ncbi:hypothetical protein CGCS363_v007493 [Colletotrichum siamense]|uniref:uncharacterized protein n=1 Tax=Colletotrichum siamense TaxID=690259 RepID=UPI0018728D3B|nr:uncharacterized protein CGCS363_v007493 [Colletotrichum siamense]KAF5500280.1 hypothetical protein CGCS363_v007493 [Colletotrichum siamense]
MASPTDVDGNGITILGRVVTRVEPLDKADIAPFILSLMALKMTANSPASAWANESIFAWIMGSNWLRQRNAVPTLLDALSHSYDPGEYNLRGVATLPDILDMFLLFRSFPELAKGTFKCEQNRMAK